MAALILPKATVHVCSVSSHYHKVLLVRVDTVLDHTYMYYIHKEMVVIKNWLTLSLSVPPPSR